MTRGLPKELLNKLKEECQSSLSGQNFDCLALGLIHFQKASYQYFEMAWRREISEQSPLWFDLASLTKPLTLGAIYLQSPQLFDEEMLLLLEHRAGLPSWGLLGDKNYQKQLLPYPIRESPTLYSDFSALRLMLEIEKKSGKGLKEMASFYWDQQMKFWRDLPKEGLSFACTGQRKGRPIYGEVHDPNAFHIQRHTSHAGLFATIKGLCHSLLNLQRETSFIDKMKREITERKRSQSLRRFVWGWDRAEGEDSLAGPGHSELTFGHLGFTGTMVWIDPLKHLGYAFLTNATQKYWHERQGLNQLRRSLGGKIWNSLE